MSRVDFFEDGDFKKRDNKYLGQKPPSKITKILLKLNLIKEEKQAPYVLVGVLVFLIVIGAWFFVIPNMNSEVYVYDLDGREYTIEEQLRAIKSGQKTFNDFR